MNKEEARDYEERRQQFKTALKPFFPTIVSVLSFSDETSKMMKEENRRKAKEALQKRAKR
jgi:hypothetical protein